MGNPEKEMVNKLDDISSQLEKLEEINDNLEDIKKLLSEKK